MLNRAVGGAFGFTTDIGGYFDVGPYQATTKELFVRWAEWAALSPFFRLHGSVLAGTHMPWTYDSQTLRLYKSMAALHRRARPRLVRLWRAAPRPPRPPPPAPRAPRPPRAPPPRPGPDGEARARPAAGAPVAHR